MQPIRLPGVLGGPDYEVTYPNGDHVTAVCQATVISGHPAPADGELSEVTWFTPAELPRLQLSRFARDLLQATGHL